MKKRCSSIFGRKAVTQTDWAVSISVFVFYLFWFFAFIRPLAVRAVPIDPLLSIVEDGFMDDAIITIDRLPLLIPQTPESQYEPIMVDFPYAWDPENMMIADTRFIFDGGRMLLLADTRENSVFNVLHSDSTYEQPDSTIFLVSTSSQARVFNFVAGFEESVLDHLVYGLRLPFNNGNISIDGALYVPALANYTDLGEIAKYGSHGDKIRHSSYVFAMNSRVYSFVDVTDFSSHNFTIHAELQNFSFYSTGQVDGVGIDYDSTDCFSVITHKIDFDDGSRGLTFMFEDEATVTVCPNGNDIIFSASFDLENSSAYSIFSHDGGAEAVEEYPITPILGFVETLEGISANRIIEMDALAYSELKKGWRYPSSRDFSISVTSDPYNTSLGSQSPSTVNVYARETRSALLADEGTWTPARINLRVW